MPKLNKQCMVCGKSYYYCYSCPSELQYYSWNNLFDTENCKKIFEIMSKHGVGKITDEETRELLKTCDLSYVESFNDKLKNHFHRVFDSAVSTEDTVKNPKKMRAKRKVVEEMTADYNSECKLK